MKHIVKNATAASVILLLTAVWGCGSSDDARNRGDDPVAESDPDVLAGYEEWERECVLWLRGDCQKAESCDIQPSSDCWDTDDELRATCRAMAAEDGCSQPVASSFRSCRTRTEGETCQEYCDSSFCFNFCFYSCADQ